MIGVDANAKLGLFDANCFPSNVGLYSDGPRGTKGRLAFSFFVEQLNMIALNTISVQPAGKFTQWDVHDPDDVNVTVFDPRQIDFIFISQGLSSCASAAAGDSSATDSDHRPVVGEFRYPLNAEQQRSKAANTKIFIATSQNQYAGV